MSKKKKNTFNEAYTINATYLKDDGYWSNIKKTQMVEVVHGVNEKNNHDEAERLFLKKYKHLKNIEIKSVTYE